ncbi:SymE family type I addiction module toxin [Candidatus Cardinium hertigii]|uniref:SymE family type I addiction module toxin n=1 Tax=Candidatus Cardinium hertigii TaxID=247481 RepID=UPI003D7E0C3A
MSIFIDKTARRIKIQKLYRSGKYVPIIRLEGKWITKIGLKIGEIVTINIRERLLIIEPTEKNMNEVIRYKSHLSTVKKTLKEISKELENI